MQNVSKSARLNTNIKQVVGNRFSFERLRNIYGNSSLLGSTVATDVGRRTIFQPQSTALQSARYLKTLEKIKLKKSLGSDSPPCLSK